MVNTDPIQKKLLDIPYADCSPAQKLDLYWPDAGEGPFPVILSVHGGGFMLGDKADEQVIPMLEGLKRGYAVVSINYRLSGEAKFPAPIQDVKAAIRWLRANTGRYDLNPTRIAAWGGSAGGHLSALAGTAARVAELEDLTLGNPDQSSDLQAVVDWFGPTDFLKMDEQLVESGFVMPEDQSHSGPDSPESRLIGRHIIEVPELVQAANPETYITPAAPPFLIQHGTKDWIVPVQQSIHFAAKLEKVLGPDKVTLDVLEGAEHGDARFGTPANIQKVFDFLDKHLRL